MACKNRKENMYNLSLIILLLTYLVHFDKIPISNRNQFVQMKTNLDTSLPTLNGYNKRFTVDRCTFAQVEGCTEDLYTLNLKKCTLKNKNIFLLKFNYFKVNIVID